MVSDGWVTYSSATTTDGLFTGNTISWNHTVVAWRTCPICLMLTKNSNECTECQEWKDRQGQLFQ